MEVREHEAGDRRQKIERIHVAEHLAADDRGGVEPVRQRGPLRGLVTIRHAPHDDEQQRRQPHARDEHRQLDGDEQRQRIGIGGKQRAVETADDRVFVQKERRVIDGRPMFAPGHDATRGRRAAGAVHRRDVARRRVAPDLPGDDVVVAGQQERRRADEEPKRESGAEAPRDQHCRSGPPGDQCT